MSDHVGTVRKLVLALALASGLGAGAAQAQDAAQADPWERLNRFSFGFSETLDKGVLGPVTHGYMAVVPRFVRGGVHNILLNLDETTTFVNRLAQLRFGRAGKTAVRFVTNTTIGLGGALDMADRGGLPRDPTDFGQTLARYGAVPGPYLYVPLMGPSTVRDSFGKTVDIFTSPLNWTQIVRYPPNLYTRITLITLDTRAQADPVIRDVRANATDPYATLRSLYLQNRQSLISGGAIDVDALPDYGPEVGTPAVPAEPAPVPAPVPQASTQTTGPQANTPAMPAWAYAVLADREYERLAR